MAARRLVIMAMMLIMLVAAVEAKDQCEVKCDKQCATHPFFPQCIRVCLIRCRRPPPPTAYSLCTLGCIDSFCTKIGSGINITLLLYTYILCAKAKAKKLSSGDVSNSLNVDDVAYRCGWSGRLWGLMLQEMHKGCFSLEVLHVKA